MLATLVIGLREGLEAALIVGIIAAFLRKNGKSLTAMWLGVALAVVLSMVVGVALARIEQALPQAQQEGMESVIGCVAIFFVTGMIIWMNTHARDMKRQLEAQAAEALGQASTYALATMAFLAVLKEGFETSVFLLATFSAAQSAVLAATGAVIGLLLAILIGWGIYVGGVRINLSRFFRITGAFLVLVAAGLVITSLRTAHEAGWLNAGQQAVMNLSWLVAPGTIRSALITGVLGIPADPRLIEVIGWLAYFIPICTLIFWPASRRPRPRTAVRLQFSIAVAIAVVGMGLALLLPQPSADLPGLAPLVAASDTTTIIGRARLSASSGQAAPTLSVQFEDTDSVLLSLAQSKRERVIHAGLPVSAWHLHTTTTPAGTSSILSLEEVVALNKGRIPIGLNPQQHPGPFKAAWSDGRTLDIWTVFGYLLDASEHHTALLTLSGSGLQTPRTLSMATIQPHASPNWQVAPDYVAHTAQSLHSMVLLRTEHAFWAIKVPIVLLLAALLLAAHAYRNACRLRPTRHRTDKPFLIDSQSTNDPSTHRGTLHAPH